MVALLELCHHGGPCSHAKFCEDPAEISSHRPGTDIEDRGDRLVRVTFGDHAGNFSFPRAEHNVAFSVLGSGSPDENAADVLDLDIEQDVRVVLLMLPGGIFTGAGRRPLDQGSQERMQLDRRRVFLLREGRCMPCRGDRGARRLTPFLSDSGHSLPPSSQLPPSEKQRAMSPSWCCMS